MAPLLYSARTRVEPNLAASFGGFASGGHGPETGIEEITSDFLEADFWPGIASGWRVIQIRPQIPYARGRPKRAQSPSAWFATAVRFRPLNWLKDIRVWK
jgi:hypothetical protein